ncbi:MAG: hypothetical protein ACMXYK_04810 [Candidatus Woesearchaeota archaeon]
METIEDVVIQDTSGQTYFPFILDYIIKGDFLCDYETNLAEQKPIMIRDESAQAYLSKVGYYTYKRPHM